MYRALIFWLFILFFSSANANNKSTLYDFRFWSADNQTKIVIDTDPNVKYTLSNNPSHVNLTIKNAKLLKNTYNKVFYQDSIIKKTHLKRQKDNLNIVFTTNQAVKIKSYTLKPDYKYKYHRLVLDLNRQQKKLTKKSNPTPVKPVKAQLDKKIIVIDPGHGGKDPGAIGKLNSQEKNITLIIAKLLASKINQTTNMKALLTRKDDSYVGLAKRIRYAQQNKASLFVSIHADAVEKRNIKGASVYTLSKKGGSTKFAKKLEKSQNLDIQFGVDNTVANNDKHLKQILWVFARQDRNIQSQKLGLRILNQLRKIGKLHKQTPQKAGFVVLKTPAIPSVLVETAFISNPEEERRLNTPSEQKKIANAIYKGIVDYYQHQLFQ